MRGHSVKTPEQRVHDEVVELLDDLAKFIAPLVPQEYKWILFVDPGDKYLKYWSGNMNAKQFQNILLSRLETELGRENPEWSEWFKAGPPKR